MVVPVCSLVQRRGLRRSRHFAGRFLAALLIDPDLTASRAGESSVRMTRKRMRSSRKRSTSSSTLGLGVGGWKVFS
jgi:hypothetical protein